MPAKGALMSIDASAFGPQSFKTQISFMETITAVDWAVFIGCIILTGLSVIFGQRLKWRNASKDINEEESFLDLLIMGRQLTLPLFVASLVATWYGGIFGVTQIAFESGIFNFLTQGVFWYLTYIIFAVFLVRKIRNFKSVSLPGLVGEMFGPNSKKVASIFNFFNCVPVAYVLSMGLFFQALFGGDLTFNMLIGLSIVFAYSFLGGFRADVFSDFVQFFIMCSSVAIVALLSYSHFGGLEFLKASLPSSHFEWMGGHSLSQTLVWGLIALATLVDPNFYQRCFAARSEKIAKVGILASTLIWIGFDICTTAGGLYARAVIPQTESGLSYMTYSLQLLPPGMRGFFLAGIFATIASTLDSFLLIASTSLSFDLFSKSGRAGKFWNHISLIGVSLLSLILASHFNGSIKSIWKTFGSYAAACLLLPVMLGYIFPRKISDFQFCAASLAGALCVSIWRLSERRGFWADVDEIYIGILATGLVLAVTAFKPKHHTT